MSITEDEFRKLKRRADLAKQTRDKAEGQLEAAMDRLREEFGCKTVESAEEQLANLKAEAAEAERAYNKAVDAFEESWGDRTES